jgi:MscS family membrane protein
VESKLDGWPGSIAHPLDALAAWWASLDPTALIWSSVFVALIFVLRKKISAGTVAAFNALLKRVSVPLSDVVIAQLRTAAEILAVTLSVYIASHFLNLPEVAEGMLHKLLSSIAVIAVFGSWFQLGGPFASLLRDRSHSPVKVETDWIERITQFAVLLFGLTALLKVWNVDISGTLTGVGVLGAGLAIAVQDLIRNLVAGMTNMSEKRFETGDAIQVEGQFLGTVRRIDLRSTLVVGFDQIPRHIPNSDLSNSVVLNYSARQHRRVLLNVPLLLSSTQAQIEAVRDGLKDYHETSGDFDLTDAAPQHVYVSTLGPGSVDILIYAWTTGPDYAQYLQVMERLTLAILRITRDAGTALAYPTQTIRMETVSPETPADPEQVQKTS